MTLRIGDKHFDKIQKLQTTEEFLKLFSDLDYCTEIDQKQKILEMYPLIEEMNKDEFNSVFNEEIFNKMDKMIEEKKMSIENAILLLKHIGYCKILKNERNPFFYASSLSERLEKVIFDENEKKEEKNEKILAYLCECYILFEERISSEFLFICVPCLLKVALKKEENEETQKEVEIALLALSHVNIYNKIEQKLYLNGITEIIEYHQEHRNLSRVAYMSAWKFLTNRIGLARSLIGVIGDELHLIREATRELNELTRCVDWTKKKGERRGKKEREEEYVVMAWNLIVTNVFLYFNFWNEENVALIRCIVRLCRAARENEKDICGKCIFALRAMARDKSSKIDSFLDEGAVNLALDELKQSTSEDEIAHRCLEFFLIIAEQLIGKADGETDEAKRKIIKRRLFEKMEEEGYEDIITSEYEFCSFYNKKYYYSLSLNISNYFVNI